MGARRTSGTFRRVTTATELPTIGFRNRAAWERWLARNHASSRGVWLQIAKKAAGTPSVSYPEALEVALCYGWIDGQRAKLDADSWLQKFTPRRPRSRWSKINRDEAESLIRDGRMAPAGLAEVERARQDGRWDAAYEGQRAATIPRDLQAALDENPKAARFFATLDSRNRYAILYRVQDAKKPETRARRIRQFVEMLARHRRIYD